MLFDTELLLLGSYPKEIIRDMHKGLGTRVLISAWTEVVESWKGFKCTTVDDW